MTEWVISCNTKQYNITEAFNKLLEIDWKQTTNVAVGDIVYIYVNEPVQALAYKCKVLLVDQPTDEIDDNDYVLDKSSFANHGRYMRLHLLEQYDNFKLLYNHLRENGLKTVQGPSKVSPELSAYISKVTSEDNISDKDYFLANSPFTSDKEVISFASADTYDLVMDTRIHAHPIKKGFPNDICPYMILRNTGGVVEKLFRLSKYIEINPANIEVLKDKLTPEEFDRLTRYASERKSDYGFKFSEEYPYRFYLLEEIETFSPAKIVKNLQGHTYCTLKDLEYGFSIDNEVILDASENKKYAKITDVLNECFGNNYAGYMQSIWANSKSKDKFRVWFPQLANEENGELVSASFDCVNTISDDWEEFVFDDLKKTETENNLVFRYNGFTLIFAKEPNDGPYIFRGVYKQDNVKTSMNHIVSMRLGTKVRVIGVPASRIEVLDEINIDIPDNEEEQEKQAVGLSNKELYAVARKHANKNPQKKSFSSTSVYIPRDAYIAESARRRAHGICQLCHKAAPFKKADGTPYLESHHIVWLSEGGEDTIENTVALCPNCHKKMHIVKSQDDVELLKKRNEEAIRLSEQDDGRRVYHSTYGQGTLVSADDKHITVMFDDVEKKFPRAAIEKGIITVF